MTRIDFHSNIADKVGYVCRLVRKARAADARIVILAEAPQVTALDAALWNFSELDFIPHVRADDALAVHTPVLLGTGGMNVQTLPHHQILINLTDQTPPEFARFERLFEIVSVAPGDIASGRERYRFYQQRGYPLTHCVADKT